MSNRRVQSEVENMSNCASGVWFGTVPGTERSTRTGVFRVMVSEPIEAEAANRLLCIPGFSPCEQSEEVLEAVDADIARARAEVPAETDSAVNVELQRTVDEAHRANLAMSEELARTKDENETLRRRVGSPTDDARHLVETRARVADLEGEADILRQKNRDLASENETLRASNDSLSRGGEAQRIADLEAQVQQLTAQTGELTAQLEQATKPADGDTAADAAKSGKAAKTK